jgi:Domain of unknown function (DUF4304)
METKEFRSLVGKALKSRGFSKLGVFWYLQSEEATVTFYLQKSSYSRLFYLNISVFFVNVEGHDFTLNKQLYNHVSSLIYSRPPLEQRKWLDLENELSDEERVLEMEQVLDGYIMPKTHKMLSRAGVLELYKEGQLPSLSEYAREKLFGKDTLF